MASESPRGVLFDFGGTLCLGSGFDSVAGNARCLELAVEAGTLTACDVQAVADRFTSILKPVRESSCLEYRVDAFQRLLYGYLGVVFDAPAVEIERAFWDAATEHILTPGISHVLEDLRRDGLVLGVISNFGFSTEILRYELGKHDLLGYFDLVVASSDFCIRKPHPLIFEVTCKMLGLDARTTWYVGDSLEFDVTGANAAGLVSVWYHPDGTDATGGERPDYTITSWDELSELVRKAP